MIRGPWSYCLLLINYSIASSDSNLLYLKFEKETFGKWSWLHLLTCSRRDEAREVFVCCCRHKEKEREWERERATSSLATDHLTPSKVHKTRQSTHQQHIPRMFNYDHTFWRENIWGMPYHCALKLKILGFFVHCIFRTTMLPNI